MVKNQRRYECRQRINEQSESDVGLHAYQLGQPGFHCSVLGSLNRIRRRRDDQESKALFNEFRQRTNGQDESDVSLQTYQLGQPLDQLRQEDTKREVLRTCWKCNRQKGEWNRKKGLE